MSVLTALGIASLVFVVLFTARSYGRNTGHGQTPRGAILEAWFNIVVGFSINYAANLLILPLVGATLTASSNFWLGCVFTAVSMIRQFAIRRWFNARLFGVGSGVGSGR